MVKAGDRLAGSVHRPDLPEPGHQLLRGLQYPFQPFWNQPGGALSYRRAVVFPVCKTSLV